MGDESTALVPRRLWSPEQHRQRRFQYPTPGRKGYPPRIKQEVLRLLETTDTTVEKICSMPGMPSHVTVWQWLKDDKDFASGYENAKRLRAARMIEQTLAEVERCGDDDIVFAKIMGEKARIRFKAAALFDPARYSEAMHGINARLPTGNAVSISISIGENVAETVTIEGKLASKP